MRPEIPILNLSDYLSGKSGAAENLAKELQKACETVGFFYISGHGIDQSLIDATFEASRQFHNLTPAEKQELKANEHNIGYMAYGTSVSRASRVYHGDKKPNLVAAFFLKRELPPDHPDIVENKRFRGANQWPGGLPDFRQVCLDYMDAMEALCLSMMPLYALALDLPKDFFTPAFTEPQYTLRLSHYPASDPQDNQFGVAPHTDSSFMTLLAQNKVAGLQIQKTDGTWIEAPSVPGTFVVNGGDIQRRWTNDRFLSTPHRAMAQNAGQERYAIPYFFDPTADFVMECLPSCQSDDNPAKYEPTSYMDYMLWFAEQNYDHFRKEKRRAVAG